VAGPCGNLTRFPILPKETGAPEAQKEIEKIDVLEALRYHGTCRASTKALNTFEVAMLTLGVDDSGLFWTSVDNHVSPGYSSLPTYTATVADLVSAAIFIERNPS
jgi:hypothetical protein